MPFAWSKSHAAFALQLMPGVMFLSSFFVAVALFGQAAFDDDPWRCRSPELSERFHGSQQIEIEERDATSLNVLVRVPAKMPGVDFTGMFLRRQEEGRDTMFALLASFDENGQKAAGFVLDKDTVPGYAVRVRYHQSSAPIDGCNYYFDVQIET